MARVLTTLFFALSIAELFSLLPPKARIQKSLAPEFRRGVIHVHSQGARSMPEIAEAAKRASLDFLVITDLGNSRMRRETKEKIYRGIDAYVELEANTPAGHAVLFYSHTAAESLKDEAARQLAWKHFLGQANSPGVFLAIAHPSSPSNPWNRLDRFSEGIEVLNVRAMAERALRQGPLHQLVSSLASPFNPFLAAARTIEPYSKDFLAWDAMNAMSPGHFAYAAPDAQIEINLGERYRLQWPSYENLFKLVTNIVFVSPPNTSTFAQRKSMTYQALQKGRSAMAFEFLYPFDGNEWTLACSGKSWRSGDEVRGIPASGCDFVVALPNELPYATKLMLYRDGELLSAFEDAGPLSRIPVDSPGVYRIEVWVRARTLTGILLDNYVPYVFYNPIYLR